MDSNRYGTGRVIPVSRHPSRRDTPLHVINALRKDAIKARLLANRYARNRAWYRAGEHAERRDADDALDVRVDGACDLLNSRHTGWWADDDGECVYQPMVYRLTHGRALAGYVDTVHEFACVDTTTVYDSAFDAARAADSIAEQAAEREREHQSQWRAYHDAEDELATIRVDARDLLRDIRESTGPAVDRLRAELRATYREARDRIETMRHNREAA